MDSLRDIEATALVDDCMSDLRVLIVLDDQDKEVQ